MQTARGHKAQIASTPHSQSVQSTFGDGRQSAFSRDCSVSSAGRRAEAEMSRQRETLSGPLVERFHCLTCACVVRSVLSNHTRRKRTSRLLRKKPLQRDHGSGHGYCRNCAGDRSSYLFVHLATWTP